MRSIFLDETPPTDRNMGIFGLVKTLSKSDEPKKHRRPIYHSIVRMCAYWALFRKVPKLRKRNGKNPRPFFENNIFQGEKHRLSNSPNYGHIRPHKNAVKKRRTKKTPTSDLPLNRSNVRVYRALFGKVAKLRKRNGKNPRPFFENNIFQGEKHRLSNRPKYGHIRPRKNAVKKRRTKKTPTSDLPLNRSNVRVLGAFPKSAKTTKT